MNDKNNIKLSKFNDFITISEIKNELNSLPKEIKEWQKNADYKTSFEIDDEIYSFSSEELFNEYKKIINSENKEPLGKNKDMQNSLKSKDLDKYKKKVIANVLYQVWKYDIDKQFYEEIVNDKDKDKRKIKIYEEYTKDIKSLFNSIEKKFKELKLSIEDKENYSFGNSSGEYKGDIYKYFLCAIGETALTTKTLVSKTKNKEGKEEEQCLNFCSNCNIPFDGKYYQDYLGKHFIDNEITDNGKEIIKARWIGEIYNADKNVKSFNLAVPKNRLPTEGIENFKTNYINTAIEILKKYNEEHKEYKNKELYIHNEYEKLIKKEGDKGNIVKILDGYPLNINVNCKDNQYISNLIEIDDNNKITFKQNNSGMYFNDFSINTFISESYPTAGFTLVKGKQIDNSNDGTNALKFIFYTGPGLGNKDFMDRMEKLIKIIGKDEIMEELCEIDYSDIINLISSSLYIEEENKEKNIQNNSNNSNNINDNNSISKQLLDLFEIDKNNIKKVNNNNNVCIYEIELNNNNKPLYITTQDSKRTGSKSTFIGTYKSENGLNYNNIKSNKDKGILISPYEKKVFLYNSNAYFKNDKNYSINDFKDAFEDKKTDKTNTGCWSSETITDKTKNFIINKVINENQKSK